MRLIDADAMRKYAYQRNWDGKITDYHLALVNHLLSRQPTVDAEPVRHGHWRLLADDDRHYECSCCGYMQRADHVTVCYKYCTNCGAKMGEEVKNGKEN